MTITGPQVPRYPDDWPKPQIEAHAGRIDAGIVRSAQKGFPQQYRFTSTAPTRLSMTFRVALADWPKWLGWVNRYGVTRWCLIPCVDQYQAVDPTPTYDWSVARFVGRIRTVPVGELYVDAQCEVDVWPQDVGIGKPGAPWPGTGNPQVGLPVVLPPCRPYACSSLEAFFTSVDLPAQLDLMYDGYPVFGSVNTFSTGQFDATLLGTDWNTGNLLAPVPEVTALTCDEIEHDHVLRNTGSESIVFGPQTDRTPVPVQGQRVVNYHGALIAKSFHNFTSTSNVTNLPENWMFQPNPVCGYQQGPAFNLQGTMPHGGCFIELDEFNDRWRIGHWFRGDAVTQEPNAPSLSSSSLFRYSSWFDMPKKSEGDYGNDPEMWVCVTHDLQLEMAPWAGNANLLACYYRQFVTRVYWLDPTSEEMQQWEFRTDNVGSGAFIVWNGLPSLETNWGFYSQTFQSFSGSTTTQAPYKTFNATGRLALLKTADAPIDGEELLLAFLQNFASWTPPSYC